MANSLLDFVMSLVRDPDAAARYAADPAAAIAEAQLTDVTSVDVDNLIPVVTESMPMAAPSTGLDPFGAEAAANVWSSGAATAAFDAFADPTPAPAVIDTTLVVDTRSVIDTTDAFTPAVDGLTSSDMVVDTASRQFEGTALDDTAPAGTDLDDVWGSAVGDAQRADHSSGFDLFD